MLRRIFLITMFLMTISTCAQTPTSVPEPGVPQTLARWRAANYSDVRYKLNLTLEKQAPALKGTMEIRLKVSGKNRAEATENPPSDTALSIILDWRKIKGKEDLSTVSNVSLNGKAVKFAEINEHLIFKEGVTAGENVIKLDFTSPIATSGAAVTRYTDKEDGGEYIYSLFVPSDASTAFPVFDQPDLKARFTLSVNKPDGWRVVSNGLPNMLKTSKSDEFFETEPISTYVFAFAAGDFKVFTEKFSDQGLGNGVTSSNDSRKISGDSRKATGNYIYVRRSQAEKFKAHEKEIFRLNNEAVKSLETYFDYKFPFPKYDLVLIPEFPFGGMEHAGATFLREASIIFPSEPTANDYISRANLIFHEAAHQWFGDTVTMRWFDDLWLKEGFAEFMAYKTLEKVLPEYNAWKAFYERNKPLAYLTDSTRGTTPIYQEIPNLSAAKSAYGNIVYRKAPAFLRQAEFYLGEKEFQTAVRAFLKKHEFSNAEWTDLVKEFETASKQDLKDWANVWVKKRGMPVIKIEKRETREYEKLGQPHDTLTKVFLKQEDMLGEKGLWQMQTNVLIRFENGGTETKKVNLSGSETLVDGYWSLLAKNPRAGKTADLIFPNYQDYGYGIFLLDEQSRNYVLKNIQNEKDAFLRAMMWGALWDSVREAELNPRDYVELAVKNIAGETDELTINTILNRVGAAMNYYLSERQRDEIAPRLEAVLLERIAAAKTMGQRVTFYRAFLNLASSANAQKKLKDVLAGKSKVAVFALRTKDKFDIVTRLLILGDPEAPRLLAELEKTETSDDAKRYAYAARAGVGTSETKAQYFKDFVKNSQISESWIEAAFAPFNSVRHADLTSIYLETALAELPNLKRSRKIFFVNGWLGSFIGGQTSEEALQSVNKFLENNQNLDKDLRLKILENVDGLERAVRIRAKYGDKN